MNEAMRRLPRVATRAMAFSVNGVQRNVTAPPYRRLSAVLRDTLGLKGTKVGCDAGDCGACTVLLDGRQVCACLTAVGQVEGREIVTVEGLAGDANFARLRDAFHAHGAAQCGICTPGMLMAAADLLARNRGPTEADVCDALGGVLCRCTGYRKIIEAVLAAARDAIQLQTVPTGRAVGSRAAKPDGLAKILGTERYGADDYPANSLWLRVVRSPHARGRFSIGDLAPLRRAHPGLVDVISASDVPENSFGIFPDLKDQPVLAAGEVRFRGEAVVALVGDYETVTRITDEEVSIRWEPFAPRITLEEAITGTGPPVHTARPDNVLVRGHVVKGHVDAALARAELVAEGEFETSYVEHAYIELEAGWAERIGDRIRIFVCTQTPYMDRDEVARVLGIDPTRVHVVPSAVGPEFHKLFEILKNEVS